MTNIPIAKAMLRRSTPPTPPAITKRTPTAMVSCPPRAMNRAERRAVSHEPRTENSTRPTESGRILTPVCRASRPSIVCR